MQDEGRTRYSPIKFKKPTGMRQKHISMKKKAIMGPGLKKKKVTDVKAGSGLKEKR